jgi:hypothetical protein
VSVRGTTLAGRRAAEARMTETCSITKPGTGEPVRNDTSGKLTEPDPVEVYADKCRVRMIALADRQTLVAQGHLFSTDDLILSVPMKVTGIKVGMTVTMTASSMDPDLVDQIYNVQAVLRGSQSTARRC